MQTTLKELVQRYAIQAREFSDSVAILGLLGHEMRLDPDTCRNRLETIRRELDLCISAADEIDRYLKEKHKAADAT